VMRLLLATILGFSMTFSVIPAMADAPAKRPMSSARSTMPLPGTQEQELSNITFPAPYNVFEFAVTCMACHSGTVDQNVAHGSNWAGTNMASAARDPIFRANEIIVNDAVPGAGNLCFRCHSPNGWQSGRFNPLLNGDPRGEDMLHSIVLSTDDEGILCEACHRAADNVKMNVVPGGSFPSTDSAFNLMNGVNDWPHSGAPYPQGPNPGDPMGDSTLIYVDGMTYLGPRPGSVDVTLGVAPDAGTAFTGQGYAVYPTGWPAAGNMLSPIKRMQLGLPEFNSLGQQYAYNPDGSLATHFEDPADVPKDASNNKDYMAQAISIEHPTAKSDFLSSSEFCGSCHELTVPIGTGMPEQRTYTEWAYSDWGRDTSGDGVIGLTDDSLAEKVGDKRCQDCHMPKAKHEYTDETPVALNPDPMFTGFFPYGKDRNPTGGTVLHKLAGANFGLPEMMKIVYPQVDMEIVGADTGKDVRLFPGMMSDRSSMWNRTTRNTQLSLREAVSIDISEPQEVSPGVYEVEATVTNNTGHRVPSGYPDGRRMWVSLDVVNPLGTSVFSSGEYDGESATLHDSRATSTTITSPDQAMIYEKVTGADDDKDGGYVETPSLLNPVVIFDNRIPPSGFDKVKYESGGVKFISYTEEATKTGVIPAVDMNRFSDNVDHLTYRFSAPEGMQLTAVAKMQYQSQSRPFMEMLKNDQPSNSPRPQGGPSIFAPNYPLTPNYLTENPALDFANTVDLDGQSLQDNWGGLAYAAWLKTGMSAPYTFDSATSGVTEPPSKPELTVSRAPGDIVLGQTIGNPFGLQLDWTPAERADGYEVWMRYGLNEETASWDRHALLGADVTSFTAEALNVGKTYGFQVVAFNSVGQTASDQTEGKTPADVPMAPMALKVADISPTTVTLTWQDITDNETGFVIQRQEVGVGGPVGPFEPVGTPTSAECGTVSGAFGGAHWVDTGLTPGRTYNYQVAAYNDAGPSTFTQPPVQAVTPLPAPAAPASLTATAGVGANVNLSWTDNATDETGFAVERSSNGRTFALVGTAPLKAGTGKVSYTDTTAMGPATLTYRVKAVGIGNSSSYTNTATATVPLVSQRLVGADRYAAAVAVAQAAYPGYTGVTDVVIANGTDAALADALSASGLSGAYKAPLFLVQSTSIPAATLAALNAIPSDINVHIVGGTGSVSAAVMSQIDGLQRVVTVDRIAGADRYAVAGGVAARMKTVLGAAMPTTGIVVNGSDATLFWDAITASAISARMKFPILLVQTGAVPAATQTAKTNLPLSTLYIIGGTGTVNESVRTTLGIPAGNRISGANRYSTAVAVATTAKAKGWLGSGTAGIAATIPDGLTAGILMAKANGPLLLTASSPLSTETKNYLTANKAGLTKCYLIGGTGSIPTATQTQIDAAIK